MIDWGKVKNTEVTVTFDGTELICEVKCIKDCPEESDILSALDDDDYDFLCELDDAMRGKIIDTAHEQVDWNGPD